MTNDTIIAAAYRLNTLVPSIKPLDLRVLGAIIDAGKDGLPLAFVRTRADLFGSQTAFQPSVGRLIKAGLVQRTEVAFTPTRYPGKGERQDRREVVYIRTAKPIVEFVL